MAFHVHGVPSWADLVTTAMPGVGTLATLSDPQGAVVALMTPEQPA